MPWIVTCHQVIDLDNAFCGHSQFFLQSSTLGDLTPGVTSLKGYTPSLVVDGKAMASLRSQPAMF